MPSDGIVARCHDLEKVYEAATGQVHALRGVTAAFHQGVMTAVVGPSGSGKSSLLRLLAGIDRPTSGSVHVGDTPVHVASQRALRALRRRHVGYVFQRPSDNLLPYLTVREHLVRAARGAPPSAPDPSGVASDLGIAHRLAHRPDELSGGEQQRAAVAQALVSGARLIVADEPTAELDQASDVTLVGLMTALRGVSLIVATHDPAVWRRAAKVLELEHGRLASTGPPGAIRRPSDDRARRRLSDPVLLETRGLTKSYRRGSRVVRAVGDATLRVRRGELIAVVGRSGSGKTTLLHLIGAWERPDRGEIYWSIPTGSPPAWAHVAVLPQRLGLMDELTVRANIEYPALMAGRVRETRARAEALLHDLGLAGLAERFPREISVGEQQRTALARALLLSPLLVLADEPTGHQDRGWRREMFAVMRAAASQGTACLVATHDPSVTEDCDRVVRMADGRLVAEDPD